jgi:type IV pilus assembly protein PilN
MIRVNLLPVKAAKKRETARLQVFAGIAAIALAIAGMVAFHMFEAARIEEMQAEKRDLDNAINKLKTELGDYEVIKAQRADLIRQKEAIERLQRARSGPAYFMRELSDILTPGKGPTFNKQQYEEALVRDPNAAINPNWDPHRAWLMTYEEKDRQVKMKVGAKSDEDVAEFLKRLKLSAFFSEVYWQQTQPQHDTKNNVSFVNFDVTCRVNY